MTVAELRERLRHYSLNDWNRLRQASLYYDLRRLLRANGRLNLALGALTLWLGLTQFQYDFTHVIQAAAGLIIMAISIYALVREDVRIVQVFSVLFFSAAAWNFWIALQLMSYGVPWLLLALVFAQVWSGQSFRSLYQRYGESYQGRPSEFPIEYDQLWTALNNGDFSEDANYVEMRVNRRKWRGLLVSDYAILIRTRIKRLMLVIPKQDYILVTKTRPDSNKPDTLQEAAASYRQGQKDIVQIKTRYHQRYESWKDEDVLNANIIGQLLNLLESRRRIRILAALLLGVIIISFLGLVLFTLQYA